MDAVKTYLTAGAVTCSPAHVEFPALVMRHEGRRPCVYRDSRGIPTVGYGLNLQRSDAPAILGQLGISYDAVLRGKRCLSDAEMNTILQKDLDGWVTATCTRLATGWWSLPQPVQAVLKDMTFNLGSAGVSDFKRMWQAINAKNWRSAADEMVDSDWCRQVGSRCTEDQGIVRSCK